VSLEPVRSERLNVQTGRYQKISDLTGALHLSGRSSEITPILDYFLLSTPAESYEEDNNVYIFLWI